MTLAEPSFPPLLAGRAVVHGGDPRALAVDGAASGELGAGDTLWLQDSAQVGVAIILEPDDDLAKAAQMLPLGVAAAGDCLAALAPPQVAINYRWPATLLLNGGDAGLCSVTVPQGTRPDETPPWIVLALSLRFAFVGDQEPGSHPGMTALTEEGIEELSTADVVESYARHFLSLLDTWTNDGFADVVQNWSGRLEGAANAENVIISHPGRSLEARPLGIDEDGNLLVKPAASTETTIALPLLECMNWTPADDG